MNKRIRQRTEQLLTRRCRSFLFLSKFSKGGWSARRRKGGRSAHRRKKSAAAVCPLRRMRNNSKDIARLPQPLQNILYHLFVAGFVQKLVAAVAVELEQHIPRRLHKLIRVINHHADWLVIWKAKEKLFQENKNMIFPWIRKTQSDVMTDICLIIAKNQSILAWDFFHLLCEKVKFKNI